jgi:acyl-CoA hydrolase
MDARAAALIAVAAPEHRDNLRADWTRWRTASA